MKHLEKGYIYILLSLISVTVFSLLADYLFRTYPDIHAGNLLFWSISGAVILGSPYFLGTQRQRTSIKHLLKRDSYKMILIGFVSFVGALLWNLGLQASSSGIVTLLGKTTFIMTILIGAIFLGEKLNKKELYALGIVILGLVCVANLKGEVSWLANIYILFSCCCYAYLSFLIKGLGKDADMQSIVYLRAVILSMFLGVYLFFIGELVVPQKEILILGPLSETFGIILWAVFYFEAHKYLPISKLNVFSVADVAMITLLAWMIFGDPITLQKGLGAFLIMFGIIWFLREQMKLQHQS